MFIVGKTFLDGLLTLVPSGILNNNSATLLNCSLDKHGVLKAFSGQFTLDNTITSPLVGYDTSAPRKKSLYIHAAQLAILSKFKLNLLLNLSSGAPEFKRMRGGEPSIEYSALFINHLSKKRKFRWRVLKFISNKFGVPLIKKYKL